MDGGNTTVWLFVSTAVLQRSVTIEFRLDRRIRCQNKNPPVGAGLLAKAACQATSALNDPPLSRASPLPLGSALLRTSPSV
ncbi:hypothetical protein C3E98_007210 [Pseudomonas sp. MWU13-2625]|nr:hypothetical protein C3E98_007210 [Pseudomonas sp. MWU13-2625]